MPKVDVSGLPIERVIIALYKNAYLNSEASYNVWRMIADRAYYQGVEVPVGTDWPPTEQQVTQMMAPKHNHFPARFIDYIGPVKLYVAFDDDYFQRSLLDLTYYDKEHQTPAARAKAPVKTAEACIADLREALKNEAIQKKEIAKQDAIKLEYWKQRAQNELTPKVMFDEKCEALTDDTLSCPSEHWMGLRHIIEKKLFVKESWREIGGETFSNCDYVGDRYTHRVCSGEKTILTEKYINPRIDRPEPQGIFTVLGTAALHAAFITALSEVIGDIFYLTGIVNEANAARIKKMTQMMMVYFFGSFMSLVVAWGAEKLLKKTGLVSEQNASFAGQAVSIGLNTGTSLLTPMGIAVTAVSLVSGQVGLFAEKKAVATIMHRRAMANDRQGVPSL